jgi:uncharacterized protein YkwD
MRVTISRRTLFVLVVVIACASQLPAQKSPADSSDSSWSPADYETYTLAALRSLPAAQSAIDFDQIDYPLLHAAVFYLTNFERQTHGLAPLAYHRALESAAFDHSVDMREYGFFSHTSRVAGKRTVPDRTGAAGFPSGYVGENIAQTFGIAYDGERGVYVPEQNGGYFSYTYRGEPIPPHTYLSAAEEVVTGWMNSPGHRANILRADYTHLGVGAAYFADPDFSGIPTFLFTQNFGGL